MRADGEGTESFCIAPTGRQRAWAFARFLAFASLSFGVFIILLLFVTLLLFDPTSLPLEWGFAIQVPTEIVAVLSATSLMARLGKRSLVSFGWAGHDRVRHFLVGTSTAFALVTLMVLVMWSASAISFEQIAHIGTQEVFYSVFYALLMLGIAVSEESLCRGYSLVALSQCMSFWPAAVTTSALFALMHIGNPGESASGIASAMLFGLLMSYSYRRTGTLWFAYGLHGGWDYAQSFIFGVPNSGLVFSGALLRARIHGPPWLTGGSAGPEGSLFMVVTFLAMLFVIQKLPRQPATADEFDIAQFRPDPIARS